MAAQGTLSYKLNNLEKQEFLDLLEKHFKGETTSLENEMLINYCRSFQEEDLLQQLTMADLEKSESDVLARLKTSLGDKTPSSAGRVKYLNSTFLKYAAAILVIVTAIFFWMTPRKGPDQPAVPITEKIKPEELVPNGNKAILTLSNGSKVELIEDSVHKISDGTIAINNENGMISYENSDLVLYNTMSTPKGAQYRLMLPDSTKVWLNAQSSITYPTAFTGSERKVTIEGEVYLEVSKNALKPFRLEAGDVQVEVLGTHFNIMAYREEKEIKTTLLEGSVKVSVSNKNILLKPNQQANTLWNSDELELVNNVDTDDVTSWLRGEMRFDSSDIRSIMIQVARWYDINVEFEQGINDITFSGKIFRRYSLSQVLEILETTHKLRFSKEGNKVIVKPYNN